MKKIINWFRSPSSDFALFVVLLILANLVGRRAFLRFDLTRAKSYSLSEASRQLVKTLDEPLSVRAFFSSNLPAPYSTTAQYVRDILVEYKGAANRNFSYSIIDMSKAENETLAQQYGLQQVQIQQLANNEVGFKQAYMGLVISYADAIETLDGVTSSDGFEYKLTTKIGKMISTANVLAGLPKDDRIKLTLYVTDALKQFDIRGFDDIEQTVREAYEKLNKQSEDRIDYEKINPTGSDVNTLQQRFGIPPINWTAENGSTGSGAIGLVLEHGDAFRLIPLSMQRSLIGYVIAGLGELDQSLSDSLQSLLLKATRIAYVTGHGESPLYSQAGASPLISLTSDMYELDEIDLSKDAIPANVASLIVNGPKTEFSDEELYKIDQFIMRGDNVMFFIDPFDSQQSGYYQAPSFAPLSTKLEKLLNAYGIKPESNYVLDENCYKARQQNYGNVSYWWAPVIPSEQLAKKNAITDNLGRLLFLQTSAIDTSGAESDANVKVTRLVQSSPKSWLLSDNIQLSPMMSPPYDKASEKAETLAALAEGKFKSAFDSDPVSAAQGELRSATHLSENVQSGKIFIAGTSEITGPQLIEENSSEPIALFTRNVIDYMNGNGDFCAMRTKGLSVNTLHSSASALAFAMQYFNEFGLAIIVVIAGFIVWRMRTKRRERIREKYNPNDTRIIDTKSKEGDTK